MLLPYAIAAAREALADAGIAVHARSEGARRLLQFFPRSRSCKDQRAGALMRTTPGLARDRRRRICSALARPLPLSKAMISSGYASGWSLLQDGPSGDYLGSQG